jgi:molybdopterin-guanine dinucleotide biosynthesis protein A
MYSDITGVILAGGKSRRMGTNKALLRISGKTLLERTAELLKPLFPHVLLSTQSKEDYTFLGLESIGDRYTSIGPLGGIHSGLVNAKTDRVFFMSCDMPLMTPETIRCILDYPERKKIVVARADGFIQQLCGLYHRALLPSIESLIHSHAQKEHSKCSVLELVEREESCIIEIQKEFPLLPPDVFYNMNRPEDYDYILSRIGRS